MTEVLLEQDKPPQFSGHETFPLRQLWLRKAYDAVTETREPAQRSVFAGEDAIVRFGVGKNMAMSIRFWATACGVVEEMKEGYVPTGLGHYLFLPEYGRDMYCEHPATTWLMHWQVASTPEKTTTWWYLFNHVVQQVTDLEKPERVAQIVTDFEIRKQREMARRRPNPLRVVPIEPVDIDDLYLEDEGGGACLVCHK